MNFIRKFIFTVIGLACLGPASAQTPANCVVAEAAAPARQVLNCSGGLVLEVEAAAVMGLLSASSDTAQRAFTLKDGAALVEVDPGSGTLQIRTPHAIAAVRGTIFAVDARAELTSVFVQRGQVDVSPLGDGQSSVLLGEGEGVDVRPGQPLEVKTWGASRVADLLARFGR